MRQRGTRDGCCGYANATNDPPRLACGLLGTNPTIPHQTKLKNRWANVLHSDFVVAWLDLAWLGFPACREYSILFLMLHYNRIPYVGDECTCPLKSDGQTNPDVGCFFLALPCRLCLVGFALQALPACWVGACACNTLHDGGDEIAFPCRVCNLLPTLHHLPQLMRRPTSLTLSLSLSLSQSLSLC